MKDVNILQPKGPIEFLSVASMNNLNVGISEHADDVLLNTAKVGRVLGPVTAGFGIVLELDEARMNVANGSAAGPQYVKAGADVGAGIAMGFFPVGTVIGGGYVVFDYFGGWEATVAHQRAYDEACPHCFPNYP